MSVFSEREQKIVDIIGRRKITIAEITEELIRVGELPFDGRILVSNSVRRIVDKCKYYRLEWTLTKSRENKKLMIKKEKL